MAVHASFRIPDRQGRVRVSVNPAIRQADGKEVVQLAIAARLRPMADDERNDVGAALDLLHEWAVNVFFGITTDGIRGHWGSNVI